MKTQSLCLATMAVLVAACAPIEPAGADGAVAQQCGADASRSLIGTHIGAVSFPQGANVRIVCTSCPTTKDLRPDRLNVRFSEATGIIESVDCG